MRLITSIEIYWDDDHGTENAGWAERLIYDDGHEEGGPCDVVHEDATDDDLAAGVVDLAWQCGVEITTGDVAASDLHARWMRVPYYVVMLDGEETEIAANAGLKITNEVILRVVYH